MDYYTELKATLSLYVVDAFTDKPFKGNPAAVCLVPDNKVVSKDMKQKIASEMNLSETAFISHTSGSYLFQTGCRFGLEWFTPKNEVPLCGHATLASAAVLFFVLGNKSEEIEFETLSGVLKATCLKNRKIKLDLPLDNYHSVEGNCDRFVKAAVGSLPVADVALFDRGNFMIRLSDGVSRKELESIHPKDDELLSSSPLGVKGVIVTLKGIDRVDCRDDEGFTFDFISRYFSPWNGISEDPVTGSAHASLGTYWSKILQKTKLYARQCSTRGGELDIELIEDRAHISGNAVVVTRGEITF